MNRYACIAAIFALGFNAPAFAQQVGIPVCDDFLNKYEACIGKQPAAAQAQYSTMMTQWRASWKRMADNPQTKPTLEVACKQVIDQVKTQMNSPPLSCGF